MSDQKHIAIIGGGLVGCLMALYLSKRGYRISVYERRPDPRHNKIDGGRSINLALSNRGIRALKEVGLGDVIKETAIPMNGRTMHNVDGNLTFQPYGSDGQYINSISRGDLNKTLIEEADGRGIAFFFDHRCTHADISGTRATFLKNGKVVDAQFDIMIGADGAFSMVRMAMQLTDRFDYAQEYIEHGYKEFHIPPTTSGEPPLAKHSLHIWPRESYMLIALPNPDNSFTGTLFFPFEGELSFASLKEPEIFEKFFNNTFPDAARLIPDLKTQLEHNPVASLINISCYPWRLNNTLLLGDACHAIVPFYGQGMNAGFEDCRVLNDLLEKHDDDWNFAMEEFQKVRKPDTDAISQLALDNFIEMRDLVGDADFLLRKKIEAKINKEFPAEWVPLYSMVTFRDDIQYAEALRIGKKQKRIMDEVMKISGIDSTWQSLDFQQILRRMSED